MILVVVITGSVVIVLLLTWLAVLMHYDRKARRLTTSLLNAVADPNVAWSDGELVPVRWRRRRGSRTTAR